jgi:hypothetical protein
LCDRDIATNFGVVAGEVILVDSCACTVIFICCDYYFFIFFEKKKKEKNNFCFGGTVHLRQWYCSKQIFWWN